MTRAVYVFDAYGTLFDVHAAVRRHAHAVGPAADRLSDLWRRKQLEYSWIRTLMGRYRDFWQLTEDALDFALAAVPDADPAARDRLLDAYRTLDVYPEVYRVLTALKAGGARLAILSNGSPAMLAAAVDNARLGDALDEVISLDEIRAYKTAPAAYDLVATRFRVYPEAVSFQSSNRWDIAGATAFGFRTVWINRTGQPDEYPDLKPAAVLKTLDGLAALE
ncbi:2-haloacid dehalogenase [Pseudoxanthobacter soli DSM 19599]|uniref:(S)-2-haloacid dehalogenase n=1 Tax=Pseudoxanthobacter soli DSM 19599 TaxID=1123029 RepID=A0A1M7ZMR2_9HYPH|nr:haloacid dehalogenase type II [Pseudoxanthobacter soli]SHO66193.1 2-haloacid dehalogenase [Pseudoxanthobacter soli DSM 19599]